MKIFLAALIVIFFVLTLHSLFISTKGSCLGYEYSAGYQFGFGFSHLTKNMDEGCSSGYHLIPIDFTALFILPLFFIFKKSK